MSTDVSSTYIYFEVTYDEERKIFLEDVFVGEPAKSGYDRVFLL